MIRRTASCVAALVMLAACGNSAETPAAPAPTPTTVPEPNVETSSQQIPGARLDENLVQVSAVVEAIDQETRQVTLRRADGETFSFRAGDEVRNLAQVQKGDVVAVSYYESVAIELRKPGEATPGVESAEVSGRAPVGAAPAGAGARTTTVVATVRELDREKKTAVLELSDGHRQTVNVRDPRNFDIAAVGDLVEITFTEAIAVTVDKPAAQ